MREVEVVMMTTIPTRKGSWVWRKGMRSVATMPIRQRVTRSPREEAIAGAMLSKSPFG
jgi:hypothetical protein